MLVPCTSTTERAARRMRRKQLVISARRRKSRRGVARARTCDIANTTTTSRMCACTFLITKRTYDALVVRIGGGTVVERVARGAADVAGATATAVGDDVAAFDLAAADVAEVVRSVGGTRAAAGFAGRASGLCLGFRYDIAYASTARRDLRNER